MRPTIRLWGQSARITQSTQTRKKRKRKKRKKGKKKKRRGLRRKGEISEEMMVDQGKKKPMKMRQQLEYGKNVWDFGTWQVFGPL